MPTDPSTHDPTRVTPTPPTTSTWTSKTTGPPSPFPWTSARTGFFSPPQTPTSSAPTSPAATPQTPKTPSGYFGLQTPPSQSSSTFGSSLSPETARRGATRTPASSRGSSPARSGLRTPSGFEFLDFGDGADGPREARSFDWELHGPASPHSIDLEQAAHQTFKRRLGPTEVSYYLGSRGEGVESGVNDMYLHIGFRARPSLVSPERVLDIWTEIVDRHPLLSSKVEYNGVNEVRFCYKPPESDSDARAKAKSLMELRTLQDPHELLDTYLNGSRTLSDERLSFLSISTPSSSFVASDDSTQQEYNFFLFSTHFLGDGMALHTTANEFFTLLSGSPADDDEESKNIEALLKSRIEAKEAVAVETTRREAVASIEVETLPQAMESLLVTPEGWGRMAWAGARVEFNRTQAKLIGGHVFPRAKLGERKTIVPTISYSADKTKKILANCKSNGTTIAHAVFALSNLAFIASTTAGTGKGERNERLPTMIYSALNVRPFLRKTPSDFYAVAIGYYNIILPSFIPRQLTPEQTFWHRARSVRQQTSAVVKSKWLPSRAKLMALERERRSIGFEIEDERRRQERRGEDAAAGLGKALMGLGIGFGDKSEKNEAPGELQPSLTITEKAPVKAVAAPSLALMGVSMLGNLDGMYAHKSYHGLELHTLTTGSRQRPGVLLLFSYTFAGKFWLSLGYDSTGFQRGVIESWWKEVQNGVEEFLLA